MEKVKVTREIADAIERGIKIYSKSRIMNDHEPDGWLGNLTDLNGLTKDEMARSLYIGYEVEPEFKVGDWVTDIHEGRNVTGIITRIDKEDKLAWGYFSYHDKETNFEFWEIRHATPSEIAKEKERRFFARHGREPWELKKGDLLKNTHNYLTYEVVDVNEQGGIAFINDIGFRDKISIVAYYKVACFIEKRLDVKTND